MDVSIETKEYLRKNNITDYSVLSVTNKERKSGFQDEILKETILYEKNGEYFKLELTHTIETFKGSSTSSNESKLAKEEFDQLLSNI